MTETAAQKGNGVGERRITTQRRDKKTAKPEVRSNDVHTKRSGKARDQRINNARQDARSAATEKLFYKQ